MMGTDRDWEKWGSSYPYYGVLSAKHYKSQNLSEQKREEFFLSGEKHIKMVFETICRVFDTKLSIERALDFGCGVGRLMIPLAVKSNHVVGVDVSPSMLAEAQRNCSLYQIHNCDFILSDDKLSKVNGNFDLIHSFLVLQHISPNRGLRIVKELLMRVHLGGFIALQFFYHCNAPTILRTIVKLRYVFPPVNYARNLYRGCPIFEPPMQLHVYNLPQILHYMHQLGFYNIYQVLDSLDNGQFNSIFLFAQRNSKA